MSKQESRCCRTGLWIAAVLLSILTVRPAAAQVTTGTIAGRIADAQGAAVPGVVVTVTSERRNTLLGTVTTDESGEFVVPNVAADTYVVEAKIDGFRPVRRAGVSVSGGERVVIPTISLEVGGIGETVDVVAQAALLQTQSGERSYTVTTTQLSEVPVSGRNFASFAALAPGVAGTARIGGGGTNQVMIDGVAAVDVGNNAQLLQLNPDAIAEVRVVTSGYQAEFGRASGIQITAVTKSGTNTFHGSGYEIAERSRWNSVPWLNQQNGTAAGVNKTDALGFTLGGPVGRPGGTNKLFFFYGHEFRPTESGGTTQRLRLPTNAELSGDFRQSTDNQGNLITLKAPYASGIVPTDVNCGTAAAPMPCRNILSWWKNAVGAEPNIAQSRVIAERLNYNYETTAPVVKDLLQQPTVRMDYQISSKLRVSGKYAGQRQRVQVTQGTALPGFNDTLQKYPFIHTYSATVNYTMSPTTFLEGTVGGGSNRVGAIPVSPFADRRNAATGFANFPYIFNQDGVPMDPGYNRDVAADVGAAWFDGATNKMYLPPIFNFGSLVANPPPVIQYPEFLTPSYTKEASVSVTKVAGRHNYKSGFYFFHSLKPQHRGAPSVDPTITTGDQMAFEGRVNMGQDASNPLDTGFGYANALLGVFSTYNQQSKWVEGNFVYRNIEGYLQDNWRITNRLTVDYGLRLVYMQPNYDTKLQSSNFFLDKWSLNSAPLLYVAGCAVATSPCPQNQRQAMRPDTSQLLGPNTAFAIGTVVQNTGDLSNGIRKAGEDGNSKYNYEWPSLALAPRTGVAYDVSGDQRLVLRGGYGLFFDRPNGNTVLNQIGNPPFVSSPVLRWSTLANVASAGLGAGLVTQGTASLTTFEYDAPIPKSAQWNAGVQMALPWSSSLDVSYVGQHSWDMLLNVDIDSIDAGAAFLPENQDPTLAPTVNGSTAVADLLRPYRGLSTIQQNTGVNWNTFHSFQLSFNRRFKNGYSFGVNDTWTLVNKQAVAPRLEHFMDASGHVGYRQRADQDTAQEMFGDTPTPTHQMRANFVWDFPDYHADSGVGHVIGGVINGWQVSGVLTASTGTPYSLSYTYNTAGALVNLTGTPNTVYQPRVILMQPDNVGSGCSSNQYSQFDNRVIGVTGGVVSDVFRAPSGPVTVPSSVSPTGAAYSDGASLGLEQRPNYLTGCPSAILDLSLVRSFRLGGSRVAELRLEAFNLFDTVVYTGRNAVLSLTSPTNPTMTAAQYNPDGTLVQTRLIPSQAGFGAVTTAAPLRTVRAQVRFRF